MNLSRAFDPGYLVRPLVRLYWRWWGRRLIRQRGIVLEQCDGVPLLVLPEVFNPVLFRTGSFLAQTVAAEYPGPVPEGQRALDVGTGSGIGAIFAARQGFRAIGVDINPEAVRCARINVLLNRLEERVEVRQGDLFEPVAGERFDLVLFNPPFFRGAPRGLWDHAWRATDVIERFAAGLPRHLAPGGRALMVLSTDGDWPGMVGALQASGLQPQPLARRDLGNEVLTVYSARAET